MISATSASLVINVTNCYALTTRSERRQKTGNVPNGRAIRRNGFSERHELNTSFSPPWPWPCLEVLSILQHFQTDWPHQCQQPKQDTWVDNCRIFISLSNTFRRRNDPSAMPDPSMTCQSCFEKGPVCSAENLHMFCAVPLKSAFFLTSTEFCVCLEDVTTDFGPLGVSRSLYRAAETDWYAA